MADIRSSIQKQTASEKMWKKIKWNLFGEVRGMIWLFILQIVLTVGVWGGIIFVAYHFISKHW